MPAEHDVDLGLAGRPGVEPDPAEHQLHQPGVAVADEVEVEVDDLGDDVDRRRRAGRRPDLDVEVQRVGLGLEDVRGAAAAPTA